MVASKNYLYGSQIRQGYGLQALRRDGAQVRCLVTGTTNDQAGLQLAISTVATALTAGVDVGDRTVPLKAVTAKRISPTIVECTAEFRYTFLNSPSSPSDTEYTDIEYEVTSMRVPVYRASVLEDGTVAIDDDSDEDSMPSGDFEGCGKYTVSLVDYYEGAPVQRMWEKPAVRITIYGEGTDPPSQDYVTACRHLNGAVTTIAGIDFAVGELRLDGLRAKRVVKYAANGTTSYKYVYAVQYTAAKNFTSEYLFNNTQVAKDNNKRNAYYVQENNPHPTYRDTASVGLALPVPTVA